MSALSFYNNNDQLGNFSRDIENTVVFGSGRIKTYHDQGESRKLAISFIDESMLSTNSDPSFNLIRINGFPISASLCYNSSYNPSLEGSVGFFYALDVIVDNSSEDVDDSNTAQDPPAKTPIFNGVPVSTSKISNKYIINSYNMGETAAPTGLLNFYGTNLSYGTYNELIVRNSGYIIGDLTENPDFVEELNFGGTPVRVGFIPQENKYYLIMSVSNFEAMDGNLIDHVIFQYKMNEALDNSVVNDSIGSYQAQSVRNTSIIHRDGLMSGAFVFDGIDDRIMPDGEYPSSVYLDSFSINVWVRYTDINNPIQHLFGMKSYDEDGEYSVQCYLDFNELELYSIYKTYSNSTQITLTSKGDFLDSNEWYMVTYVFNNTNGGSLSLYLDSVHQRTTSNANIISSNLKVDYPIYFGCINDDGSTGEFYEGLLDNAVLFDKALSQTEINFLFNGGIGTEDFS